MGGIYGISKAAKLNEEGKYEEAVVEAGRAIALDDEDPEARVERAFACAQLERYTEAVEDLERAFELDEAQGILETDLVDDAYFSAVLAAARKEAEGSVDAGVALLGRYGVKRPAGRHLKEMAEWMKRLRGEVQREFVKRRLED